MPRILLDLGSKFALPSSVMGKPDATTLPGFVSIHVGSQFEAIEQGAIVIDLRENTRLHRICFPQDQRPVTFISSIDRSSISSTNPQCSPLTPREKVPYRRPSRSASGTALAPTINQERRMKGR